MPEEAVILITKDIGKLIGRTIEIIYQDRSGKITQRTIEVHGIKGVLIRATCLTTGAPRVFRAENILAWQHAKARHAG
jgi:predicted DNA-binding transcriptional regulator YafY